MIRNPETAYLVSNEEFDKNWMPSVGHLPIWSRCQECTSKRNVRTEKIIRDWFRELLEVLFQAAALVIDSIRTFFLIVLSILYPFIICHIRLGWLSAYSYTVAFQIHICLSVVACSRSLQCYARQDTGIDHRA